MYTFVIEEISQIGQFIFNEKENVSSAFEILVLAHVCNSIFTLLIKFKK